ncbi:MAG TPA: hypothetical protein O0X79_05015, partial [Methanocorpusculum sp.]|nr:hypothetical protein [Methanocorpusculum sp.]
VVIVCIGAVGAGSVIFKKRRDHHGFDTFPAPRRAQEQQPVESDRQKQIERPAPAPTPEPILPAEPKKPIMIPSDAGPAELFELVAETIAKNRGIGNSKALAPRELIDPTNPDPQLIEYIALYEKVRYSKSSTPGDTARLKELAARILKENA